MDRDVQIDVVRRALAHHRAGTTDRSDRESRHPASDYLDPERHRAEAAMFATMPIVAAHSSQLARPGDFVSLTVLDTPVLVVRDRDGRANAFVNVCRHRAATLVTDPAGEGLKAMVCPYHSWSYDLTGRLTTIPDGEASFPDCAARPPGLIRLPVAERHGFVWVVPSPAAGDGDTTLDLPAFLGDLDAELAGLGLDRYVHYTADAHEWAFNWKTGVEGFLENYHFSTLHRRSTNRIFLNNLTVVDTFGPHVRAVAPKRSMLALADVPEAEWELRPHATTLYVLFPGLCLFVEKAHVSLLQIVPLGPERSAVRISHVVGRDGLAHRAHWDRNIALFAMAVQEDLEMCESTARGLRARPSEHIVFGRNETGCAAFRDAVDLAVEADRWRRPAHGAPATGEREEQGAVR